MEMHYVNLYEYCSLEAPTGADGRLRCIHCPTSREYSSNRRRPAVLVIPGGGYGINSAREDMAIALRFLAQGYVPFMLNYATAPQKFPTQLREAAMAMRYIRENAATYEVDPTMVAAIGFSAGGHLCGMLGMMYDCPEVADIAPAAVLRPDALALCYPVILGWGPTHEGTMNTISGGDAVLRQRLSLDTQVRSDMPPVFLWHTRDDKTVPCRNSIILAQKLDEAGVDFTFHLYRSGCHGLSTGDVMTFRSYAIPDCSADAPGWLESCMQFWAEIGFHITDQQ